MRTSRTQANPNRDFWSCPSCHHFVEWVVVGGRATHLTSGGPKCKCGRATIQRTVRKEGPTQGKLFWTCASTGTQKCNFFEWNDSMPPAQPLPSTPPRSTSTAPSFSTPQQLGGPASSSFSAAQQPNGSTCAECNAPVTIATSQKANENHGKRYYKCAKCAKFAWVDEQAHGALPDLPAASAEGCSVEYAVSEAVRRQLQRLFDVPDADRSSLGLGRDAQEHKSPYDSLEVVYAWAVENKSKDKAYEEFVARLEDAGPHAQPDLDTADLAKGDAVLAADEGQKQPLRRGVNEALLLHGSHPESLHAILFEGLDPALARNGLYGNGTYLAQEAVKADQYATTDSKWAGSPGHPLRSLHSKLYNRHLMHPASAGVGEAAAHGCCYALVCRAALSSPVHTADGSRSRETDEPLFANAGKTALAGTAHALIAVPADDAGRRRFREVVLFERDAVKVEYLVAYVRRSATYCRCGARLLARTVSKEGDNKARMFRVCPLAGGGNGGASTCPFGDGATKLMLPLCYCGRSATVQRKRTGERYFKCAATFGGNRAQCSFVDWNNKGCWTGGKEDAPMDGTPNGKRPRYGP